MSLFVTFIVQFYDILSLAIIFIFGAQSSCTFVYFTVLSRLYVVLFHILFFSIGYNQSLYLLLNDIIVSLYIVLVDGFSLDIFDIVLHKFNFLVSLLHNIFNPSLSGKFVYFSFLITYACFYFAFQLKGYFKFYCGIEIPYVYLSIFNPLYLFIFFTLIFVFAVFLNLFNNHILQRHYEQQRKQLTQQFWRSAPASTKVWQNH